MKKVTYLSAAVVAAIATFGVSDAQAQYLKGKDISVLVGFPPGSSATLVVRTFAPFWSKHTPGNPNFVVKNMPGAAGSKAVNFLYEKGPKDASTILFSPSKIAEETMGAAGARATHTKFSILGLVYDKHMAFARTDVGSGIKTPADVVKAGRIKMAARGRTGTLDVTGRAALDLLGAKHQFVCCYRGAAKMTAAMRSGEAEMANVGISGYRANYEPIMVKKGDAIGLYYMPTVNPDGSVVKKDPEFPDMPALAELYEQIHGKAPSGVKWESIKWLRMAAPRMAVAAPGTNPEAVAALREGFVKAQQDPEFIAVFAKRFGTKWTFFSGSEGAKVFSRIKDADPAVVKHLKATYFSVPGGKPMKK